MLKAHFEIGSILKNEQDNQVKINALFKFYNNKSDKDKAEFVLALIADYVFAKDPRTTAMLTRGVEQKRDTSES